MSFLTRRRRITPNHITLFRFATAGALLCLGARMPYWQIWVLAAMGGISDFLDGALARAASRKTRLGMILDPLADKFLVFVILYVLLVRKGVDLGIVLLMVAMEAHLILVPVLGFTGKRIGRHMAPRSRRKPRDLHSLTIASQAALFGKVKFVFYALGLMTLLLGNAWDSYAVRRAGTYLLVLGIASGAVALGQYLMRWRRVLGTMGSGRPQE